jgi:predicted enzyme related to lactoylglutathione lyase
MRPTSFLTYPVSDIKAARHFYEDLLGLKLAHEPAADWCEYNLGDIAFGICPADAQHAAGAPNALLAFEVADLEAEVARLRKFGATIQRDIAEAPSCRFAVVLDPDGSEIIVAGRLTPEAALK